MLKKSKLFLLFVLLIPCWGIALRAGIDYSVYYKVSEWVNRGKLIGLYKDSFQIGGFYYGPLSLVLLKPLALFSFDAGHWVFLFCQTLAYVCFWFFLMKLFPERNASPSDSIFQRKHLAWLLVWAVAIKPIHSSFQCYNIQLFYAAAFILAEFLTQSKKSSFQFLGGVLISLIASIKFFPGFIVLLYWIIKSNRVRLGTIAGAALAVLIPVLAFGWETGIGLHFDLKESLHLYHSTYPLKNQIFFLSLPSLLATWLSPFLVLSQIEAITLILNLSLSLLFFVFAWKQRNNLEAHSYLFALGLALMTIINTSTRVDYYVFFIPAFCVLTELWQDSGVSKLKASTLIAFALMYLVSEWTLQSSELNHRLEAYRVPVVGMLILLASVWIFSFLKLGSHENGSGWGKSNQLGLNR